MKYTFAEYVQKRNCQLETIAPQQVPGYQSASPQGQQLISGVQNSINNLSGIGSNPTAQRMNMPIGQANASLQAQAKQAYDQGTQRIQQQTTAAGQQRYQQLQNYMKSMGMTDPFSQKALQGLAPMMGAANTSNAQMNNSKQNPSNPQMVTLQKNISDAITKSGLPKNQQDSFQKVIQQMFGQGIQ